MRKLCSILLSALLVGGAVQVIAADQPAKQKGPSKEQQAKDKPQGKPSGNQRRTNVPET